jgi:hypothetical protein
MAEGASLRIADDVADTVAFSIVDDGLRQNEVSCHKFPLFRCSDSLC